MKKFIKSLTIFLAVLLVTAIALSYYIYTLFQPVQPISQPASTTPSTTHVATTRFVIPKGQATSIVAERLEEEGYIKNNLVFRLIVKKDKLETKLQAGSFEISPSMTVWEIAEELTKGTNDLWVTIPEGWRKEEIAESLAAQDLEEFDQTEFLSLVQDKEGMLFPDTYLLPKMMTTESIVNLLLNTFEKKITNDLFEDYEGKYSQYNPRMLKTQEVLIMASLLEREAKGYEQMRHVAGILYNRLDIDMALQADATMQYAKGYEKELKSWWVPPTAADKQSTSLYNTYKYSGLPPGPICNPGFDAIKAALNPLETNNLFYIHDRQGKIYFAATIEEHNANVNQYLR